MQDVYADWADALQGFSVGAIQHGLDLAKLDNASNPPTQGQFIALCKTYKPMSKPLLVHKITEKQLAENKRRIADIVSNLAKKQSFK